MKNSDTENDKTVPQAAGSAPDTEELIAPGTPIQFDIVLPASEFLDQNRGSRYGLRPWQVKAGSCLYHHRGLYYCATLLLAVRTADLWLFLPLGVPTLLVRRRTRPSLKQKVGAQRCSCSLVLKVGSHVLELRCSIGTQT